jgi:3-methyladenine DNA glycosylase AlkD
MATRGELIADLQKRLDTAATPATKDFWDRYLKGVIRFRGVKMGDVRRAVHAWHDAHELEALTPSARKQLAYGLLRQPLADDKLAGILYLQEVVLPAGEFDYRCDLADLAGLFDRGHIYEWNTCDWLCVKVLGPLIEQQGEPCARAIGGWRTAPGLWRRRAAGVAFVNMCPAGDANFAGFVDLVLEVCSTTVQDPARFAQTGTGWVLRELSVAEPERVAAFLRGHRLSREAFFNATAKLPARPAQAATR